MQRTEVIKTDYENIENLAGVVRRTQKIFGRRETPCRTEIQNSVAKTELWGKLVL